MNNLTLVKRLSLTIAPKQVVLKTKTKRIKMNLFKLLLTSDKCYVDMSEHLKIKC
jgi:hypothetical protein